MSSISFLIVYKYCKCVKWLRKISRVQEEIFQNLWKRLYGSVEILTLEGLNYSHTCKDITLTLIEDYDDMRKKILISKECSEIFGYGIGRRRSIVNFKKSAKKFIAKHGTEQDKEKVTEIIHILIENMKGYHCETIRYCIELLKNREQLGIKPIRNIGIIEIQLEINRLFKEGSLKRIEWKF